MARIVGGRVHGTNSGSIESEVTSASRKAGRQGLGIVGHKLYRPMAVLRGGDSRQRSPFAWLHPTSTAHNTVLDKLAVLTGYQHNLGKIDR